MSIDKGKPIKIFVMCRNKKRELNMCINSIILRTRHPFEIIIVDNASDDIDTIRYLNSLSKQSGIQVHRNRNNLWVLGLNPALKKYLNEGDNSYVVTDGDIVLPMPRGGMCWLERLLVEMSNNPVIGKLGLSLDLGYLANKPLFSKTFEREKTYYQNLKIGDNYIAPVDTTLALYRTDYFVMNIPRFYPGHGVLAKPHYYCCRTADSLVAKHVGWRSYSETQTQRSDDVSKVICFTLMGAYLDEAFLEKVPLFYRLFFKFFRPISRALWAVLVLSLQLIWFVRNSPTRLNECQRKAK